jgi:hypothetical protein
MFYTVNSSIITNEGQQNAQMIYIFSIYCTYIFGLVLTNMLVKRNRKLFERIMSDSVVGTPSITKYGHKLLS